jgi:hypothetical protein
MNARSLSILKKKKTPRKPRQEISLKFSVTPRLYSIKRININPHKEAKSETAKKLNSRGEEKGHLEAPSHTIIVSSRSFVPMPASTGVIPHNSSSVRPEKISIVPLSPEESSIESQEEKKKDRERERERKERKSRIIFAPIVFLVIVHEKYHVPKSPHRKHSPKAPFRTTNLNNQSYRESQLKKYHPAIPTAHV